MSIDLRIPPREDLRSWFEAVETASSAEVGDDIWRHIERTLEPDRVIGAYDGERMVGGAAAFSFEMTVPGGRTVGAAGVSNVGVMPTHRRRGILRQMMARQLADIRSRGEPVAILWASEGGIYQRFGYGIGSLSGTFDVSTDRATFRSPPPDNAGTVRLVDQHEAARIFPPIYESVRAVTPGFLARTDTWWDAEVLSDPQFARRGFDRKFYALYERDGQPAAYALYRVKLEWGDIGTQSLLVVQELISRDGDAQREMWRFVFGVDLIARVRNRFGPPVEPLLLQVAEPRRLMFRVRDGLWLRIVDVPAALSGRGYAADGIVTLQVDDEFMPDAGGRWRIDARSGSAIVTPTADPADIQLDAADLGAVYLGAFTFAQLGRAGRTRELTGDAWGRADALFRTSVAPWSPQIF